MTESTSAADDFAAENYELDEPNFPDAVNVGDAVAELSEGYDPHAVESAAALSTQETSPASATGRTALQVGLASLVILGLVTPEILEILAEDLKAYLPDNIRVWLLGAAGFVTALAAAVARIMAIPGVNDFFREYLPWLAPQDRRRPLPGEHVAK